MGTKDKIKIAESREMIVSKANDLVQKCRYKLSIEEQKTVAYIVSIIKPRKSDSDPIILEYEFDIREFCRVCGFDYDNGNNYIRYREVLRGLRNKSIWVPLPDGSETTAGWLAKVWMNKRQGMVKIRLDEDMLPFLFDYKDKFTEYQLLDVLAMTSKYSFRLYELLKSYANLKRWTFDADELQKLMDFNGNNFAEFERKALKVAEKEINQHTALNVRHEITERGRYNKVSKVKFYIYTKGEDIKVKINDKNHEILDEEIPGQINIDDYPELQPEQKRRKRK